MLGAASAGRLGIQGNLASALQAGAEFRLSDSLLEHVEIFVCYDMVCMTEVCKLGNSAWITLDSLSSHS